MTSQLRFNAIYKIEDVTQIKLFPVLELALNFLDNICKKEHCAVVAIYDAKTFMAYFDKKHFENGQLPVEILANFSNSEGERINLKLLEEARKDKDKHLQA